jgi:hypothetical protein
MLHYLCASGRAPFCKVYVRRREMFHGHSILPGKGFVLYGFVTDRAICGHARGAVSAGARLVAAAAERRRRRHRAHRGACALLVQQRSEAYDPGQVRRGERPNQPPPPQPLGARRPRSARCSAAVSRRASCRGMRFAVCRWCSHGSTTAAPTLPYRRARRRCSAGALAVRPTRRFRPVPGGRSIGRPRGIHLRVLLLLSRVVSSLV